MIIIILISDQTITINNLNDPGEAADGIWEREGREKKVVGRNS